MYAAADPYRNIHKKPPGATRRLAPILEDRAAAPQQQALRQTVFAKVLEPLSSSQLTVVDIGCGTGAIARDLARAPAVSRVIGIDPAPFLVEWSRVVTPADKLTVVLDQEGTGVVTVRHVGGDLAQARRHLCQLDSLHVAGV